MFEIKHNEKTMLQTDLQFNLQPERKERGLKLKQIPIIINT